VGGLLELAIFLGLLATGYVVGRVIEQRHYASIRLRERRLRDVLAFPMRFAPDSATPQQAFLVHGTVVVSADYFKSFVAGLRNLVGGRFRSYETLLERARREAVLRLKEEARARGARLVVCVRFETTSIARGWAPAIEVLAYGTALIPVAARAAATAPSPVLPRTAGTRAAAAASTRPA
jgi:uncharacterized protein YbjQ (UPF0145 family)